jgi:hypothetical protein
MIDINLIQWPAMGVTVAAAWLVASDQERRRNIGFWVFMLSNVLWIVWGWYSVRMRSSRCKCALPS